MTNTCTPESLRSVIASHGGVLYSGAHNKDDGKCFR
jgi:hypothetical protein